MPITKEFVLVMSILVKPNIFIRKNDMRKIDKKLNIIKANLLAEQRYLNTKNGITENFTDGNGSVTGSKIMERVLNIINGDVNEAEIKALKYKNGQVFVKYNVSDPEFNKEYILDYLLDIEIIKNPVDDEGDRWTPPASENGELEFIPLKINVEIWEGGELKGTLPVENPAIYFTEEMGYVIQDLVEEQFWTERLEGDEPDYNYGDRFDR